MASIKKIGVFSHIFFGVEVYDVSSYNNNLKDLAYILYLNGFPIGAIHMDKYKDLKWLKNIIRNYDPLNRVWRVN